MTDRSNAESCHSSDKIATLKVNSARIKMVLYARLDRSAVEGLARRFGISDITAFSVMDGGYANTSYCVETSSGRYVLTIFDQLSLKDVTNLANLLVYMTDQGFRTSRVVVPPKEPIVVLHNEKPVMLKRYIDGDDAADFTGTYSFS